MLRFHRCDMKQRKVMWSAQVSQQDNERDWKRSEVLSGPGQVSGSLGFFATRVLDRQPKATWDKLSESYQRIKFIMVSFLMFLSKNLPFPSGNLERHSGNQESVTELV